MKGGNKFFTWAKAYSLQRQIRLMFCCLAVVTIILCIIGILVAKSFKFNIAYIPLQAFALAFITLFLFRKFFFNVKTITKLQLKYLLKQKEERGLDRYKDFVDEEWKDDSESRNADDYKEITAAINEV